MKIILLALSLLVSVYWLSAEEAPAPAAETSEPAVPKSSAPEEKAAPAEAAPAPKAGDQPQAEEKKNSADTPAPGAEAPVPSEPTASLFIESDPIGAQIRISGQTLSAVTPTLVRGLKPGEYSVELFKTGSKSWEGKVTVGADKAGVVKATLLPNAFVLTFPQSAQVSFNKTDPVNTEKKQFQLPSGTYTIDSLNGQLKVDRVFPEETLVTLTGWAIPFSAGFAAVATVNDLSSKRSDAPPISLTTGVLWFLCLGDTVWHVTLQDKKARFLQENAAVPSPQPEELDLAVTVFAKAEDLMDNGKIDLAAREYQRLVRDYPESSLVPGTWFKLARIHALKGDRALAKGEYNLAAETFQQSDSFDRAHKALADMESADGNYLSALYHLKQLVYLDPLVTPEDVQAQIADLQAKVGQLPQPAPEAPHAQ